MSFNTLRVKLCESCKKQLPENSHRCKRFCDVCVKKKHLDRSKNRYYVGLGTIIRNICIKKRHQLFIKKTHLKLSTFIQEKLDEEMNKRNV